MRRFSRRASATILGAILAAGIPTGFVLAASENARHGIEVSAVAKTNIGGVGGHGAVVSEVARNKIDLNEGAPTGSEAPEANGTPDAAPKTHPDNHGADVSAAAKDKALVGGKHDNHGGAVSAGAPKP